MQDYTTSTARDFGFADAINGESRFNGYLYFTGAKLAEYFEGYDLAQQLSE